MRTLIVAVVLLGLVGATNQWAGRTQRHVIGDDRGALREGRWTLDNAQAVIRGTFWEIRRSMAILAWAEAQAYFHGGFDLTAFTDPSGSMRAGGPPDNVDHDEDEHQHDDDHGATGEDEGPRIHTPAEIHKIALLRNHPFLKRSPLRPYVFGHSHENLGPKRMMPFYWLTTQLDPDFVRAYTNGAYWLAFKFNQTSRAMQYLERGLHHNPEAASLYASKAHILFLLQKDYAGAIANYERAIALNPGNTEDEREDFLEWSRFLGRVCLRAGQYDQALQVVYRAKRLDPRAFGFDSVISEATTILEGHPQTD